MTRFKPEDFGYDFASSEEQEALVATVGEAVDAKKDKKVNDTSDYELYRDEPDDIAAAHDSFKYHPRKGYRGEHYVSDDSKGAMGGCAACLGAVCCCLTISLVIAGGILLSYEQYKDSASTGTLVGSIMLVFAAASCVCACCVFCIGAVAEAHFFGSNDDEPDPNLNEVKVRFRRLNDRYEKECPKAENNLSHVRLDVVGHMPQVKEAAKKEAKEKTALEKKNQKELEDRVKKDLEAGVSVKSIRQKYRPVAFLIVFDGDVAVSNMELLRKQVSLVVNLGRKGVDQCVVVVTSPGGAVSQYGLAASQLVRIRKAGIHLVVCVDTVAASGGYMMTSVANKICAAPFAIVGSIGVVTHIPNFQRFLNDKKIDAYLMTAGEYKRTIDVIGEVTEEGKAKLKEELDDIHAAFKDHIAFSRPKLKETIEKIATGEHWLAVEAKELGLVDDIMTSDEYLESVSEDFDIIEILEKKQKTSIWRSWHEAALSAKSVAKRLQSTVEAPEKSPMPMAIV